MQFRLVVCSHLSCVLNLLTSVHRDVTEVLTLCNYFHLSHCFCFNPLTANRQYTSRGRFDFLRKTIQPICSDRESMLLNLGDRCPSDIVQEIFSSMTKFENIVYFKWLNILSEARTIKLLLKLPPKVRVPKLPKLSLTVLFISIFFCGCQASMWNGNNCQRCAKSLPHYLRRKTTSNSRCVATGEVHFRSTSAAQNVPLTICNARQA